MNGGYGINQLQFLIVIVIFLYEINNCNTRTALWIAESQTLRETANIVQKDLDFLPLKTAAHIERANAHEVNWSEFVPVSNAPLFIISNPPFVGYSFQSEQQKNDMLTTCTDNDNQSIHLVGKLDYNAAWYFHAVKFIQGRLATKQLVRAVFVSTNSLTQGEQVAALWRPLIEKFGVHIDFAYRTFQWDSESNDIAHVHCVIVGFSVVSNEKLRRIFTGDGKHFDSVDNITPYLTDGENIFIESRNKPICNVPMMRSGNRPADGGHLILSQDERNELIAQEPAMAKYVKRYMMGYEFINNVERYCLWLVKATAEEIHRSKIVRKRVEACKADRLASPDQGRRNLANTPALFREQLNPDYAIVIPQVSSERRFYIPIGYVNNEIVGNNLFIVPDATIYHFGVLTSSIHMAWMRVVCGRFKSDYRYSISVVYNNFPWPSPTDKQKAKIEQTAQAILDARALEPNSSLAALYDDVTMPVSLRKAHGANDRAVMSAYGFDKTMDEPAIVAALMKLYKKAVKLAGAKWCEIRLPVKTKVAAFEVPVLNRRMVIYGGLEAG